MYRAKYFLAIAFMLAVSQQGVSQDTTTGKRIGIFDGRTPCQELAGQLAEKTTSQCTKIKWRLILFDAVRAGIPGRYKLWGFVYKKGSPRTGTWRVSKGTAANPDAVVYELTQPGKPSLFLQRADENIFFFLDPARNLMVGNRDFSYTLNRNEKPLYPDE